MFGLLMTGVAVLLMGKEIVPILGKAIKGTVTAAPDAYSNVKVAFGT